MVILNGFTGFGLVERAHLLIWTHKKLTICGYSVIDCAADCSKEHMRILWKPLDNGNRNNWLISTEIVDNRSKMQINIRGHNCNTHRESDLRNIRKIEQLATGIMHGFLQVSVNAQKLTQVPSHPAVPAPWVTHQLYLPIITHLSIIWRELMRISIGSHSLPRWHPVLIQPRLSIRRRKWK